MKRLLVFFLFLFLLFWLDSRRIKNIDLEKDVIQIEIKGHVKNEGIFDLPAYSTFSDAIKLAEPLEDADLSNLNGNMKLKDNDSIVIQKRKDEEKKISINYASIEELIKLPGIGKKTAERIIQYRDEYGLFQELEDMMKVKGIGKAKYEKILPYICL